MGFTPLLFTTGQKLSHTVMEQMDANFDAIANGDESAPRIPRPRLWVHFCGFSTADNGIYVSNGISSFQRNSTGHYSVSFTTPLSSTNVGLSISTDSGFSYAEISVRNANAFTLTTTGCSFRYRAANNAANAEEDQVAIFATIWDFGAGNY